MIEVTGGLYLGHARSEVVAGSIASAVAQGVDHEVVGADEIRRRWPAFAVGDGDVGLFDPGAGMIRPERAIEAQLAEAERRGAELRFGERVVGWRPAADGGGVEVETAAGLVAAGALVIAAGAWTGGLLPDLALPLEVERMPVFWFRVVAEPRADLDRLPVWIFDTDFDGAFYGFASEAGLGLKAARHHSGDIVPDVDALDREARPVDLERVRVFARRHLPAAAEAPVSGSLVCTYTNTPDLHFVVDAHPSVDGVAFASACSGHGFKFAPVIGEILADLALAGATTHPIDAFRAARFGAA
jgi:sarcosine oxidase